MTENKTFDDIKGLLPNLFMANLRGANLSRVTLCGATIDGVILSPEDIGGPGHILCALTESEWQMIKEERGE